MAAFKSCFFQNDLHISLGISRNKTNLFIKTFTEFLSVLITASKAKQWVLYRFMAVAREFLVPLDFLNA